MISGEETGNSSPEERRARRQGDDGLKRRIRSRRRYVARPQRRGASAWLELDDRRGVPVHEARRWRRYRCNRT